MKPLLAILLLIASISAYGVLWWKAFIYMLAFHVVVILFSAAMYYWIDDLMEPNRS